MNDLKVTCFQSALNYGGLWLKYRSPRPYRNIKKILWILTYKKCIRLDCVEEGLDERCYEPHDVAPCRVLVLKLAEVPGDRSRWTGSIRGGRLNQAEQQQHSKAERSSVTQPTPAPRRCTLPLTCRWHQWGNVGENTCGRKSPWSTTSARWSGNKTEKNDKCNDQDMMRRNNYT